MNRQEQHPWQALITRYAQQPAQLSDLAARFERALPGPAPAEGEWSLHQVLVHTRDAEAQAYLPRLERILAEDMPVFVDFDAEMWMRECYDVSEPVDSVLADFAGTRSRGLALMAQLTPTDWLRRGQHPEVGSHLFAWWVARAVEHVEEHLADLSHRLTPGIQ